MPESCSTCRIGSAHVSTVASATSAVATTCLLRCQVCCAKLLKMAKFTASVRLCESSFAPSLATAPMAPATRRGQHQLPTSAGSDSRTPSSDAAMSPPAGSSVSVRAAALTGAARGICQAPSAHASSSSSGWVRGSAIGLWRGPELWPRQCHVSRARHLREYDAICLPCSKSGISASWQQPRRCADFTVWSAALQPRSERKCDSPAPSDLRLRG